ncbi:MAG: hypothetical protein ACREI9_05645 [Nitrospiraceae bacterium]
MKIAMQQVTKVDGELFVDASDIGIGVGADFPKMIEIEGRRFFRTVSCEQDGDLLGWEYETGTGYRLTVAND